MEVNYVAVLVAALAAFVVGFVWYMPGVFGKAWMRMSGVAEPTPEQKKKMGPQMLAGFVAQLVMAYVLYMFIPAVAGEMSVNAGLMVGFWAWLGFHATISLGSVLWERKPFQLYLLNTAHWLVALLVMGAVLGAMG